MNKVFLLLLVLLAPAAAIAADTGFVEIGEDRIYYEIVGRGYPLVLIGGGSGMGIVQWHRVVPYLAKQYRVVSYDPRGIGRSDNPTAAYSDSEDFRHLADQLGLDRVGLVGLSSSGGLALEIASAHVDRIAAVVAAAPFVPGFEFSPGMLERVQAFAAAANQGREPFLDAMFRDPHFIPAPLDPSVRVFARQWMGENYDKSSDFDATLPIEPEVPLIEKLSTIEAPLLLLAGELDHADVRRRNDFLAQNINGAITDVIRDSGHNPQLENPAVFLEKTIAYFDAQLPPPGQTRP